MFSFLLIRNSFYNLKAFLNSHEQKKFTLQRYFNFLKQINQIIKLCYGIEIRTIRYFNDFGFF